jgi:hypothetical protein
MLDMRLHIDVHGKQPEWAYGPVKAYHPPGIAAAGFSFHESENDAMTGGNPGGGQGGQGGGQGGGGQGGSGGGTGGQTGGTGR